MIFTFYLNVLWRIFCNWDVYFVAFSLWKLSIYQNYEEWTLFLFNVLMFVSVCRTFEHANKDLSKENKNIWTWNIQTFGFNRTNENSNIRIFQNWQLFEHLDTLNISEHQNIRAFEHSDTGERANICKVQR